MCTCEWWSPTQLIMDTIIYLFFSEGEGEIVGFNSKLSHSFTLVALLLLALSWILVTWFWSSHGFSHLCYQSMASSDSGTWLTTHGTKRKKALHAIPLSFPIESSLPPTPTFDTSLPVLPIPLPPPLRVP